MDRVGPLTVAAVVAILDAVLSGLVAAHAAKVIHRDLKRSSPKVTMDSKEPA